MTDTAQRPGADDEKLRAFFDGPHACPDCGSVDWTTSEDGGHDIVFACNRCGARFGVQMPPFNLIERLP